MVLAEYEETRLLTTDDCDHTGGWKMEKILSSMQNLAGSHADSLGAGFRQLRPKDLAWVISKTKVEMEKLPLFWHTVTLKTWTGKERHGIYPRYFSFHDEKGELLGGATVYWSLMDLAKRQMATAEQTSSVVLPASEKPPVCKPPKSVRLPDIPPKREIRQMPVYSELDVNGHLNNTKYVAWFCDLLGPEFFEKQMISSLTIHYAKEILPKQEVTLRLYQTETGYLFSGLVAEEVCFSAETVIRKRKDASSLF